MKTLSTPLEGLFREWGADFLEMDHIRLPLRIAGAGQEYEAARCAVMLADGGDRSWVEMRGYDLLDFLQRILSSDVRKLTEGSGQWSAMLDGKGHWIADLLLYRLAAPEGEVCVGVDIPTECLKIFLEKVETYHFAEDLEWRTPKPTRLLLLGPGAAERLEALGWDCTGDDEFANLQRGDLRLLRRPDRGSPCWDLQGPTEEIIALAQQLRSDGAVPGGWVALDILRVEDARPRWGADFDHQVTLPASNEWHRASLEKGCYAGQETVAKIHTYGEAPRQLCRLRFEGPPLPLSGAEIRDEEGHKMGRVTSWVWSPQENAAVGLGMVRRRLAVEGQTVQAIHPEDGRAVPAVVSVPEKRLG